MRSSELLNEAVAGDITVGFELECIVPIDGDGVIDDRINNLILENRYTIGEDSSVQPDDNPNRPAPWEDYGYDNYEEMGVEIDIGSVPGKYGERRRIVASPSDFAHVAKFIADMYEAGMYTNETCGFHAHFGLGELRSSDALRNFWFANYFIKEGMFNRYSHFTNDPKEIEYNRTIPTIDSEGEYQYEERAGIPQYEDQEYASFKNYINAVTEFEDYLNDITSKEAKIKYALQVASSKYGVAGFEKYNLMNVHEQGTIEWRGLRLGSERDGNNFRRDQKHIMDYLKFVYKFAVELARSVDRLMDYEIGGVTLREVQRAQVQQAQRQKGLSSALIEQFRGVFEVHFGFSETIVKDAITRLSSKIRIKSSSTQYPLDIEQIAKSMTDFAILTDQIFQQGEYYGTILEPNIILGDKQRFELELKQANFSDSRFDFRGIKDWQRLIQNHGFSFVDCVFEDCSFFWSNPSDYGNFNGPYGFDDCTFIDCQWNFPGGPGFKSDPTWNQFMANEGIDRAIYNYVRGGGTTPVRWGGEDSKPVNPYSSSLPTPMDAEEYERQADHITEGTSLDGGIHSPEFVVKNFGEVVRYRIENGKFVKDPNGPYIHLFRRGKEEPGVVMSENGLHIMNMKTDYGKWHKPTKAYQNMLAKWKKLRTKTNVITDYELSVLNKNSIENDPNLKIGKIKRFEIAKGQFMPLIWSGNQWVAEYSPLGQRIASQDEGAGIGQDINEPWETEEERKAKTGTHSWTQIEIQAKPEDPIPKWDNVPVEPEPEPEPDRDLFARFRDKSGKVTYDPVELRHADYLKRIDREAKQKQAMYGQKMSDKIKAGQK